MKLYKNIINKIIFTTAFTNKIDIYRHIFSHKNIHKLQTGALHTERHGNYDNTVMHVF